VDELLSELAKADLIHRYEVDGKPFICLPGWAKHQRVDNAGKSRIPEPIEGVRKVSPRTAANDGESRLDQGRDQGPRKGATRAREIPQNLQPVFTHLDRVAFSRELAPPDPVQGARVCEEFADRDLDIEADKFAHYYTEGAGENRRMRDVVERWREWLRNAPSKVNASRRSGAKKASTKDNSAYAQVEPAT
jgi:hypothetical protein